MNTKNPKPAEPESDGTFSGGVFGSGSYGGGNTPESQEGQ